MTVTFRFLGNFIPVLIFLFFLAILQTSFRPLANSEYFSWVPESVNWLPVIVYFSLYRKPLEGIISCYLALLALSPMTVSPPGLFLLASLVIFILCQSVKSRVFWNGPGYFCLLVAFSTFAFQFVQLISNFVFFDFYIFPNILIWFPQALVTLIPAYFSFYILNKIDQVTDKEPLTEVTGDSII